MSPPKRAPDQPVRDPHYPPPLPGEDPEMDRVEAVLRVKSPTGDLFASVLRETLDQLYDGQRTGRYRPDQLRQTESTHMGSLVEINLHRAFDFGDGTLMDYLIDGIEVDCKFSKTLGGWMIPQEAARGNHLLLVVWADDRLSKWAVGLVRATEIGADGTRLLVGGNQDKKRSLSVVGQSRVRYLYSGKLAENLLLHLDRATVNRIFDPRPRSSGKPSAQDRVDMLFRLVQQRLIHRGSILTVSQTEDSMRRARQARDPDRLGREGILVFGHQDGEQEAAHNMGLPVPRKGSLVSARVVPAEAGWAGPSAEIEGSRWRLAQEGDPVVAAPVMPKPGRKAGSTSGE